MSMVPLPRRRFASLWLRLRLVAGLMLAFGGGVLCPASGLAQRPPVHFQHAGNLTPGAIGSLQLTRGGPLRGVFQPVEIKAPEGALVSLAQGGQFDEGAPARTAAMLIAPVYRLRVTNIPRREGLEVYPTVEIIDRLYAPPGQQWRFPIPIELTLEELNLALEGKFITRVIYLEDPDRALAIATGGLEQQWFQVGAGENPLEVADTLGRPMAILRLGGRLPEDLGNPSEKFLYGSPPWVPSPGPEEVAPPQIIEAQPTAVLSRTSERPSPRGDASPAHQPAAGAPALWINDLPQTDEPKSPEVPANFPSRTRTR